MLALLDELEAAEKRIAELEARAVTVKLPMPYYINVAGEHIDWEKGDHFDRDEVIAALRAAGITVKGIANEQVTIRFFTWRCSCADSCKDSRHIRHVFRMVRTNP